jgi:lipid-A-disaccharide synthase
MLRIGIVAGEPSGDKLAAGLVRALRRRRRGIIVEGICGPALEAEGCRALFPMERLAVMGLVEVWDRYLELVAVRREMRRYFLRTAPDVFIGVDAPDFNLELERDLRRTGIRTVHCVSPTVWAWRRGRIHKVAAACDLLFALYPFEADYYAGTGLRVEFIGHPLADRIPQAPDTGTARAELGIASDGPVLALLPGSRSTELDQHLEPFLATAAWCHARRRDLRCLACAADDRAAARMADAARWYPDLPLVICTRRSLTAMQAANVVLLASGTAALEAMLLKKPMVVAYRVAWLSYQILKRMIQLPYVSLPNILAARKVVPEFFQENVQPEVLGPPLLRWLEDDAGRARLAELFADLHDRLRRGADDRAAEAILELLKARQRA